jgi:hypothetical protein
MSTKLNTKPSEGTLYDRDFYEWAFQAAEKARAGVIEPADREYIAEELEDMARRDERELKSRLRNVISHMLKWTHQPDKRSRSWAATIQRDRAEIETILEQSPSLRRLLGTPHIEKVYVAARRLAIVETGLDPEEFPERCAIGYDQILDPDCMDYMARWRR